MKHSPQLDIRIRVRYKLRKNLKVTFEFCGVSDVAFEELAGSVAVSLLQFHGSLPTMFLVNIQQSQLAALGQ